MSAPKIKFPQLNKNDEYDTPLYAFQWLDCFAGAIRSDVIWDPFVSATGSAQNKLKTVFPDCKVVHDQRFDLFNGPHPDFDLVITNPPYSCKQKVFDTLLGLDKPFCLLVPLETLSRKYMLRKLEKNKEDFLILLPHRRVDFEPLHKTKRKSHSPFHSVWVCYRLQAWRESLCSLNLFFIPQQNEPVPKQLEP
jgi:hypothetical protein